MLRPRTWQIELGAVGLVLIATVVATGGAWREIIGSLAVLAGFAHAQVSDRLAEWARTTDGIFSAGGSGTKHSAHCWRWSGRYFVAKELLWLVYFVSLQAWSALVGVGVFLLYPLWRRWRRA